MHAKTPHHTLLWVSIFVVIAAAALLSLWLLQAHRKAGEMVTVTCNGTLVDVFPLDEDRTVTYRGEGDGYNVVTISGGTVQVTEASCPDQICVRHAPTANTADPIVCLPNRLVVEVVAGETDLDGVS